MNANAERVIQELALQVVYWMNAYNAIRPEGTLGVVVPSIEQLIAEAEQKFGPPEG